MDYVNLYTQTEYTMLESNIAISSLPKKAIEKNYKALGMADSNNMHGAIKFYTACLNAGIKPIIGLRLSLRSEYNYENAILLYAKNNQGYRNLLKIASLKATKEEDISINDIKDKLSDLVLIIPSDENELIKAYINSDFEAMQKILKEYLALKDINNLSLYLGVDVQTKQSKYQAGDIIYFAKQNGINQVAIRKTNYFEEDDYELYKILKSIKSGGKLYHGSEKEADAHLINAYTMGDMFRKYPELITETEKIAEMCNVEFDFDNYHMPKYIMKDDSLSSCEYLKNLALFGLKKRLENDKIEKKDYQVYIDRLNYELDVISKMGFSDYFLIVYDFVKYAKKEGILVGPGRGSGPGSLVAYAIGITEINPIKFNLLFERFLNPERVSMPDIDTDFPDDRREQVIRYMGTRYGTSRVAHICTFGTYGPRLAIRDIARVIDLKEMYLNSIINQVPPLAKSIQDVLDANRELVRMAEENETIKKVLDLTRKMENLPRNLSVHAAGIIMADTDLTDYTPLSTGIDGLYQTQFEAGDLEKIGLVKIDFLGIRNLTIITKTLEKVGISGKDALKIYNLPLNDKEVYKMISQGKTDGIFQLESGGMRKTLIDLKTSEFSDIVNAIALYRPGPMEMIPTFINRKFGKEKVIYPHPLLEPILKDTYGVIVYQEQILEIARAFAGFSLGEADILRRAVSKKKEEILASQQEKFINGAIAKGFSREVATSIYELILKFANYGFNKSHSVSYSMISYQMAYLKCRYLKEFMAVLMSYSLGRYNALKGYIKELASKGISVEPPDVNYSTTEFNIVDNKVYFSLLGVNGVGEVAARELISERAQNGPYKSYDEFIYRTKGFLTRKVVEALIYAGALDTFGVTRKSMILEYDKSLNLASYGSLCKEELRTREFDGDEFSFVDISNLEKNALGFNIKYDIFRQYGYLKKKYQCVSISSLKVGTNASVLFVLDRVKVIKTKKGDDMAFVTISDDTDTIDATIFTKAYLECQDYLVPGKMLVAKGRVDKRNDKKQFVIENVFINNK